MKSKKILTILLSLAIMFTFMPAMAFAATTYTPDQVEWDLQNKTVKTPDGDVFGITVTFSDGMVVAQATGTGANVISGTYTFYDLDNASIISVLPTTQGAEAYSFGSVNNVNLATYNTWKDGGLSIKFAQPSYTDSYNPANPGSATISYADFKTTAKWDVTASIDTLTESDSTQNAKVTASWKALAKDAAALKGTLKDVSVYVTGNKAFKIVDASGNSVATSTDQQVVNRTWAYDGKAHTFTAAAVAGYSVAYAKWNAKTNSWDPAEAISAKDVADSGDFRARFTKGTETPIDVFLTLTVSKAAPISGNSNDIEFGFDSALLANSNVAYKVPAGSTALSFINFQAKRSDDQVYAVDKEEAMKYFADAYDVTETATSAGENIVTWTVTPKSGVKTADLYNNHKVFCDNYGITSADLIAFNATNSVTVEVAAAPNVNTKDDDISFEGQTSFTYSGKKTTKKGVLKAKKTITVKATSDSGNAITYVATKTAGGKITVSAAGKITVKKGLKKGTYKVTVKAKTAAGNGYKAASEKQTYVIKIKK